MHCTDLPSTHMKFKTLVLRATIVTSLFGVIHPCFAQGTAFSYQGRLSDNGSAADGNYDLQFTIHDAPGGGGLVAGPLTNAVTSVNNGFFTVLLNFGAGIFTGGSRWLEIGVRTNGSTGAYAILTPRQALTPTPYAISAAEVTGTNIARLNVPNTATPATAVPTVFNGFLVGATLTSGGSGYTTVPAVTVNDSSGSGAIVSAAVSNGLVTSLRVQNAGSGYSSGATLTIASPPSNAYQVFGSSNYFAGVNSMVNPNNTFGGTFSGSGAGLTGVVKSVNGFTDAVTLNAGNNVTLGAAGNTITIGTAPVVNSVNGLTDAVTLNAGSNITIAAVGNTITVGTAPVVKTVNGLTDMVTLNAGNNITLGTAANGITIGTAAGLFGWQLVSSTNQQAQPNTAYLLTNDTLVTVTLPLAPNVGDMVRIFGSGTNGWRISQKDGQSIFFATNIFPLTPNGATWTSRAISTNWVSVSSSVDGSKLIAAVNNGSLYTSTDSGVTWIPRESSRNWFSVASSADGTKLAAVVGAGQIYISTDSGTNWTPRETFRNWRSIASSADGTELVAVANGSQIYVSSDAGVTWASRETPRSWQAVACSADGIRMVAAGTGALFISSDFGTTWAAVLAGFSFNWSAVACSADGMKIVAVANNTPIYISNDGGTTWAQRENSRSWTSVASSSDGSKLIAAVGGGASPPIPGQIYTSSDSGLTWTVRENNRDWRSVATSADGTKLVAVVAGGNIYTFTVVTSTASGMNTTIGTGGFLTGGQAAAIELVYIGAGRFSPVSFVGAISAN